MTMYERNGLEVEEVGCTDGRPAVTLSIGAAHTALLFDDVTNLIAALDAWRARQRGPVLRQDGRPRNA
jgi:hypothetical protein